MSDEPRSSEAGETPRWCDRSALPLVPADLTRRGNSNVLERFSQIFKLYRYWIVTFCSRQAGGVVGHEVSYVVKQLLAEVLEDNLRHDETGQMTNRGI